MPTHAHGTADYPDCLSAASSPHALRDRAALQTAGRIRATAPACRPALPARPQSQPRQHPRKVDQTLRAPPKSFRSEFRHLSEAGSVRFRLERHATRDVYSKNASAAGFVKSRMSQFETSTPWVWRVARPYPASLRIGSSSSCRALSSRSTPTASRESRAAKSLMASNRGIWSPVGSRATRRSCSWDRSVMARRTRRRRCPFDRVGATRSRRRAAVPSDAKQSRFGRLQASLPATPVGQTQPRGPGPDPRRERKRVMTYERPVHLLFAAKFEHPRARAATALLRSGRTGTARAPARQCQGGDPEPGSGLAGARSPRRGYARFHCATASASACASGESCAAVGSAWIAASRWPRTVVCQAAPRSANSSSGSCSPLACA